MLRRQGDLTDPPRENRPRRQRFGDRQTSLISLLDSALNATIKPGKQNLDGLIAHPGFIKQRSQRRPRPLRCADALTEQRSCEIG